MDSASQDSEGVCEGCLAHVEDDWFYCSRCGRRLTPSVAIRPRPEGGPVCDNCEAPVDLTGAFCWKCGVPLSTGREPFIPLPVERTPPVPSNDGVPDFSEASGRVSRRPLSARFGGPAEARRRSVVAAVCLLIGVGILLASLIPSWYGVTSTDSETSGGTTVTVTGTEALYPLNHVDIVLSCQGYEYCSFFNQSWGGTYQQFGTPNLGYLYDSILGLISAGAAIGLLAAVLALSGTRGNVQLARRLALVAVLLAVLAPMLLLVAQPPVLKTGAGSGEPAASYSNSPANSFFGNCAGTACGSGFSAGSSAEWGPSLGWYLPLLAAPFLFTAFWVILQRSGRRPQDSIYQTAR